jgi:hypothetical protein
MKSINSAAVAATFRRKARPESTRPTRKWGEVYNIFMIHADLVRTVEQQGSRSECGYII